MSEVARLASVLAGWLHAPEQVAVRRDTLVYGTRPYLVDPMAATDLGLGTGGATAWERRRPMR